MGIADNRQVRVTCPGETAWIGRLQEFLVAHRDKPDVQCAAKLLPGQAMVFFFLDENEVQVGEMKVEVLP